MVLRGSIALTVALIPLLGSACRRGEPTRADPVPAAEHATSSKPRSPPPAPSAVPEPPNRPSLEAKVSPSAVAERTETLSAVDKLVTSTRKLANAVPAECPLTEPACRDRFKAFADALASVELEMNRLGNTVKGCFAKTSDEHEISALKSRQLDWLGKWQSAIEEAATPNPEAAPENIEQYIAWQQILTTARHAHPVLDIIARPCPKR